ncbi:lanthionine synthetase LanC family protein [Streptomyces tanashiensis]|uniref:Uncharacterized protein n=1 Tax=Streptomyces tanashiensis TaxID=67367 RepID=A0ABY6QRN9_9ACTN|nr:lanthionine synthetase LanC family protein [Streptomyces tanashiensis]UZX19846.1 hypothetical protein LDH80_03520 [Streptomyces tanashiensis]
MTTVDGPLPQRLIRSSISRLATEALWDGGGCTWLAPSPDEEDGEVARTVGPHVYGGTAGIGFALSLAHAATGDETAKRLALGAFDSALGLLEHTDAWREGYFTGSAGVFATAGFVADVCSAPLLRARSEALLKQTWAEEPTDDQLDVVSGLPGTILGLAALPEPYAIRLLMTRAEQLLTRAESSQGHTTWAATQENEWLLTGFAHGASGIAAALFSAYALTDATRFLTGANEALHYEDQWFDPAQSNWADLRGVDRSIVPGAAVRTYSSAWCHGAPGCLLARWIGRRQGIGEIRTPTPDMELRRMCDFASPTTPEEACLCHGLLGLLDLNRLLTPDDTGSDQTATPAGTLLEAAARTLLVPGGDPGLLLGTSGLLHYSARLLRRDLVSILACGTG